jgi:hypothetical protein
MKDLERRLQRLERRFGTTAVESESDRRLRARLEAAYRHTGHLPPSPERLAQLRGMSLAAIVLAAKKRSVRRGLALRTKGQPQTVAFEKALSERPHSGFVLYGIAVANEQLGDSPVASKTYADFPTAWKDADAGLPQIAHARAYLSAHRA